jgi:hypothetical protein
VNAGRHYSQPSRARCDHCGKPAEEPKRLGAALLCAGERGCWALVMQDGHPATALRDSRGPCDRCAEGAGDA